MLKLNRIKISYDEKVILNDINLDINEGELVSILGPSGCGKSTLLNIILGLTIPDSGDIYENENNITLIEPRHRGYAIAFQNYALFDHLNCLDNIMYGTKNLEYPIEQAYIDQIIDVLQLREHLTKKIKMLSGGQKQRVSLARALAIKPKILLLDEPLSALDGVIKERIKGLIKEINKKFNISIVMVTHDPEEAMTLSDKICILNEGMVEMYGTPKDIYNNHQESLFINNFIKEILILKHHNINKVMQDV